MKYETVIGMEVHVELHTESKMFCACPAHHFQVGANEHVCPVCTAQPGALPVINGRALELTAMTGLALHCQVRPHSVFARKNYVYPDLPKGYQISQYELPICEDGWVDIDLEGGTKRIGIVRVHLEEDTGKLVHESNASLVDYNRAGVPLMEIVSEPDMRSADEAHAYLTAIKQIMQYAGVSDCDMEKGQMRCDVNISVRPVGQTELGEKIEIKNLNSTRAIHRAIGYEIGRQIDAVEDGEPLRQETRRWDDEAGFTSVMRTKEDAHDYRYFPEPDLMPVNVGEEWLTEIRADLPESPQQRRERFVTDYGITEYDAQVLTDDKPLADYYEEAATGSANAKSVANWIMTELLRGLSDRELAIAESPVPAAHMAQLIGLIEDNTISGKIAKAVFAEMLESGKEPKAIVKEKGLVQVTDTAAIDGFVEQAISDNPSVVEDYRGGKKQALQFLVGQVMKFSRGKANPQLAIQALKQRLDG